MASRLAAASASAMVDALSALLNGGKIEIRDGYQPATPDTAATGTLLVTITPLNNPAFGAAADGIADANVSGLTDNASASGTAGWFRAYTSGSVAVLDGSCSASGGSGDMQLSDIDITSGQPVTVDSWSLQMPVA